MKEFKLHFEGDIIIRAEDEDEAFDEFGLMSDHDVRENINYVEANVEGE